MERLRLALCLRPVAMGPVQEKPFLLQPGRPSMRSCF